MTDYKDSALRRAKLHNWYGFSFSQKEEIKKHMTKVQNHTPDIISLIHGDPHSNNFLVQDGKIYAFDKSHEMFSGSHYIDLAIVLIDYCNEIFIDIKGEKHQNDKQKINAFVEGYGRDFLEDTILYSYIVLIAFRRMNSPYTKQNKDIILNIFNR